jgi:hypothetical protein
MLGLSQINFLDPRVGRDLLLVKPVAKVYILQIQFSVPAQTLFIPPVTLEIALRLV